MQLNGQWTQAELEDMAGSTPTVHESERIMVETPVNV